MDDVDKLISAERIKKALTEFVVRLYLTVSCAQSTRDSGDAVTTEFA